MIISFEGIDACGKSTQVKILKEYLISKNYAVVDFREPGASDLGEKIRFLLLDKTSQKLDISPLSELLLFMAARAQLAWKMAAILAENKNSIIILDRFIDSSLAYQTAYANLYRSDFWHLDKIHQELLDSVNRGNIEYLNQLTCPSLFPDRTYFLDLTIDDMAQRLSLRNEEVDRLEKRGLLYQENVRKQYLILAEEHPDRIVSIDATKSVSEISQLIIDDVNSIIQKYNI